MVETKAARAKVAVPKKKRRLVGAVGKGTKLLIVGRTACGAHKQSAGGGRCFPRKKVFDIELKTTK